MTNTAIFPIIIVIIILTRIKRIINRFLNSGTLSFQTAKTLEELKLSPGFIFNHLIKQNVIIEAHTNVYYLNEENLKIYTKRRRMVFISIISLLLFILLIGNIFFSIL